MASLATVAAVKPSAAIKGLGGSSLAGAKLSIKPSRLSFKPKSIRANGVVAKYGDKSVYFDLEDLGNTTGQWDVYGSDAPSPYNPLQSKFFETFAAPFTKRGLLLKFLILGGGSLLTYVSATSTGEVLPIKRGPQEPPKLGPRGKL
ncbi:putative photosystem I [Arabidopsis thaliana]|jgi:photosystem I subunit 6|uniref:Photosystem I reaction center subunit VI-1, chloroplastic n=6 Tax=Arabidopsis TaxID=3701 RepID=PSAH1_ARATH|nr:photosystem I subunit H-1 [Arabidopsis thaliana]Q9SUI7.1 RecName: Full=Photosystem I reaction center subunit VI-1, chloroplastic; AltName: Full=PSI-H1; Flags: Precursor [Arabidopsis thaliana]KAG7625430.1 Photosystem I PsaH reaction centre subunit VI [Arabidopsis thaliana x Arabidopsis arenosa]KAG7631440.1 Photosystem I PsaH reaction centre subunit VI [Arabidopsis suecica]AAM67131.1 photosystem I subunit VI precursor [Arabidopsis thaliana]ABI49453.1 At3g16140 [Arabidopsis thaliana]AEE75776.|eukprot:NP_188235.1 photosystem I subunit H-1 [Arabidopsis thaliana]